MQNCGNWIQLISDRNVLRVLFYLDKYNPEVTVDDLRQYLRLDEQEIRKIVVELIKEKIVETHHQDLIKLTERGQTAVGRLKVIA